MVRIFSARVQDGVIVAEGLDLPNGTLVTVAANDAEAECDLAPEEMAELDAAIAEADAGDDSELVSHEAVLASLDEIHASR